MPRFLILYRVSKRSNRGEFLEEFEKILDYFGTKNLRFQGTVFVYSQKYSSIKKLLKDLYISLRPLKWHSSDEAMIFFPVYRNMKVYRIKVKGDKELVEPPNL
jgi:hypothetical protein